MVEAEATTHVNLAESKPTTDLSNEDRARGKEQRGRAKQSNCKKQQWKDEVTVQSFFGVQQNWHKKDIQINTEYQNGVWFDRYSWYQGKLVVTVQTWTPNTDIKNYFGIIF